MNLITKAWLASQGLLVVTAVIIQATFYREIKVGPMLGMQKREYWDIIKNVEPQIPKFAIENNLPPKRYDARLELTQSEIERANLGAYRKAYRQEEGIRMAFKGGIMVNLIYFTLYHLLVRYFKKQLRRNP